MDVDFMIQEAFMLTRPQWKLITNLEEASQAFAEAVKLNYQTTTHGKPVEADEVDEESSSEDEAEGADDEDVQVPEGDDEKSSGEEAEVCFFHN